MIFMKMFSQVLKHVSTEKALLGVFKDLLLTVDSGNFAVLVPLFNSIYIGIKGTVL